VQVHKHAEPSDRGTLAAAAAADAEQFCEGASLAQLLVGGCAHTHMHQAPVATETGGTDQPTIDGTFRYVQWQQQQQ
jgi:hypothetical protein